MTKNIALNASPTDSHTVTKPTSERPIASRKQQVQSRLIGAELPPPFGHKEILVVDDRAHLRPAQIVEIKLTRLLQEASVPVSHLQMRGLLRAR
jgi:hypothetical protein